MISEVRIYDGEGNLKETVIPELLFDNMKKFQSHKCSNKGCKKKTTNRHYCSPACRVAVKMRKEKAKRVEKKRLDELKPKRTCANKGCKKLLDSSKKQYCEKKCAREATRANSVIRETNQKKILKEIRESGKAIC